MQQSYRDVMYGNAARSLAVAFTVVRVAMDHKIRAMPIDHFRKAGCAEKGINLLGFTINRRYDWSIVQYDDSLFGSQLRHGTL